MDNTILEYLEGYFGGQLNESTSDEDIMSAFVDLLETADAVEEYLDEAGLLKKVAKKLTGPIRARRKLQKFTKDRNQSVAYAGDLTGRLDYTGDKMAKIMRKQGQSKKDVAAYKQEVGKEMRRVSSRNRAAGRVRKLLGKK